MTANREGAESILATEEHQQRLFLTEIRPVGEEKSELYPEPQYFYTQYMTILPLLPSFFTQLERSVGASELGRKMRRILSPATALHASGLTFLMSWAREMWLLENGGYLAEPDVVGRIGTLEFSDRDARRLLHFFRDWVRAYRADGRTYPSDDSALGPGYRILDPQEIATALGKIELVRPAAAQQVKSLLASARALSFLMEGETREALMMHGAYETGAAGESLVFFECSDLQWTDFLKFPLPDGARWQTPDHPFPHPNLAIAMVLRNATITSDRFGTLYMEPFRPENIVGASLYTRGVEDSLAIIDLGAAAELQRKCDEVQEAMFLQLANWDFMQRLAAGHYQSLMVLVRILRSSGAAEADVQTFLRKAFEVSAAFFAERGASIAKRSTDELPFYGRTAAFLAGEAGHLFSPLHQSK